MSHFSAFKFWHNPEKTLLPPIQLYFNDMWGFFNVLLSGQNFIFQMDLLDFHICAIFGISDMVAIRATSSMDIFCLEKNKMKIVIPYIPMFIKN